LKRELATMALFAAGLLISALGVVAKDLWTAVAFISIATACHQAWSANMFTVASDALLTCREVTPVPSLKSGHGKGVLSGGRGTLV
jgi:MFS transporter, ACS family, hexuronate transporter